MNKDKVFINVGKPAIKVKHSKLKSVDGGNYKRFCPACKEGILLVGRERLTLRLLEEDRCILCGQRVKYTDIQQMRTREGIL